MNPSHELDKERTRAERLRLGDSFLADLRRYAPHDARWRGVLRRLVFDPGYAAVALWRIAQWMQGGVPPSAGRVRRIGASLLNRVVMGLFSVEIHLDARAGPGLRLAHGHEIVVGSGVVLGSDVTLYNCVTLGARKHIGIGADEPEPRSRYPSVGDGVVVYPGARIVGKVRIGSGASIGANAVVLEDVPEGSVAVGVPARSHPADPPAHEDEVG